MIHSFSWARYDSLRLDPEPGTSIWGYEIEEEPEPDAEPDTDRDAMRCANAACTHRVYGEDTYCHVCLDLQHIGQEEYKRARARGWED